MKPIANGVYPTMITPFTDDNQIDYKALDTLVEWYIERGVHGLFAVCQSSEMFRLSLEERVELSRFVVRQTAGRVPVIASGHVSDTFADQRDELLRIADTGVDAVVLVSNRLAGEEDSEDVWKIRAEQLMNALEGVVFGIYECPYPYKRLLSPELLQWCAATGRFAFLKDTCCSTEQLDKKLKAVQGSSLRVFNANSVTLLESLKLGAAGFSGVMANFHPDLYVWLVENWQQHPEQALEVQNFLGVASLIELQQYPLNAKYYLRKSGIPLKVNARVRDREEFKANHRMETDQLKALEFSLRQHWDQALHS